ncbi:hypothetical protein CH50_00775, partial [Paenibacillus darwinianus]
KLAPKRHKPVKKKRLARRSGAAAGQGQILRRRKRRTARAVSAYRRGYNQAYNEGYNSGFAKGFEDGHQLIYESQP